MEKKSNLSLIITIAFAAILVCFLIGLISRNASSNSSSSSTEIAENSPLPTLPDRLAAFMVSSESEEATESVEETTPAETESEETAPHYTPAIDNSRIYYTDYRFKEVGPEYFDDAVFIGNSRMQGFVLYSKLENLTAYTSIGMSVHSYFTKTAINKDGVDLSASEALERNQDFQKVYIKLGINEIGYTSPEPFIAGYSKIMEHIYSCNPNAIIYIFSVLPVSHDAMEKDPSLDIDKINAYNEALQVMAARYGAVYLDIASILVGEDGFMPPEAAFDGVHLNTNSVQIVLDYLLKHGI